MASLRGEPVDRPPVSFYELNGVDENPDDPDPFNIYSDPSWAPLLELTREKTDRIVSRGVPFKNAPPDPLEELTTTETRLIDGSWITHRQIRVGGRVLTERWRTDPDIRTVWNTEHLLKDVDDLKVFLDLPSAEFGGEPDIEGFLRTEEALGDTGIVMIDTPDPLCFAGPMFEMGLYTIVATTEPELFHRSLERAADLLHKKTEAVAEALPGRLWRIYGPEYASPPYMAPRFFRDYVVRYDTPMVRAIQQHGGYARIHSHGNLKPILDDIASTGCSALDPIEPPPQGDVDLSYVRQKYGEQMTLFGNLEVSDIETLDTPLFREKVRTALCEGTAGEGRGFVLMPSACPYGRHLSDLTVQNYEAIIEEVEIFADAVGRAA